MPGIRLIRPLTLAVLLAAVPLGSCVDPAGPEFDPVPVQVAPSWPDVAAGEMGTCMLDAVGTVFCWGYSGNSWLGGGSQSQDYYGPAGDIARPRPVQDAPTLARIVAMGASFCGLTPDGVAYCWGRNIRAELGDGTAEARWRAEPVVTELRFKLLAGSAGHVCGLTGDGHAHCWGNNFHWQLGGGEGVRDLAYGVVPVVGGHRFTNLVAGSSSVCGMSLGEGLYCWGADVATTLNRDVPTLEATPAPFDTIALGGSAACGLVAGSLYCRGWNGNGALATGDTDPRPAYAAADTDIPLVSITLDESHGCGLTSDARAYCWGGNLFGKLGDGTSTMRLTPVPVAGDHRFVRLSAGYYHTCGLKDDGRVFCWGGNEFGQLGTGDGHHSSVPVPILMPGG